MPDARALPIAVRMAKSAGTWPRPPRRPPAPRPGFRARSGGRRVHVRRRSAAAVVARAASKCRGCRCRAGQPSPGFRPLTRRLPRACPRRENRLDLPAMLVIGASNDARGHAWRSPRLVQEYRARLRGSNAFAENGHPCGATTPARFTKRSVTTQDEQKVVPVKSQSRIRPLLMVRSVSYGDLMTWLAIGCECNARTVEKRMFFRLRGTECV